MNSAVASKKHHGATAPRLLFGFAAAFLPVALLLAAEPGWWAERCVKSSVPASDYAAVNQGQLKAAAKLMHLQLIRVGYTSSAANSWISSTSANANDYAMANIGQVKQLFAWNLMATGTDGLPTWWKNYWSTHLNTAIAATDPATGLSYLQEFTQGRTPGVSSVASQPSDAVALEIYTPLR